MPNNFFTIDLREKLELPEYRKSYPRNQEMYSNLTFDLYFKVKSSSRCLFCLKMSVT
jgi:hypothetical protein